MAQSAIAHAASRVSRVAFSITLYRCAIAAAPPVTKGTQVRGWRAGSSRWVRPQLWLDEQTDGSYHRVNSLTTRIQRADALKHRTLDQMNGAVFLVIWANTNMKTEFNRNAPKKAEAIFSQHSQSKKQKGWKTSRAKRGKPRHSNLESSCP
ncbi:hypothetical protein V8F33_001702 [Rhypophila sp. PSN 637]